MCQKNNGAVVRLGVALMWASGSFTSATTGWPAGGGVFPQ